MRRSGLAVATALTALALASISAQESAPAGEPKKYGGGAPVADAAPRRALPPAPAAFADAQALADYVDLVFADAWKEQGLAVGAPVDDATWLRRLSLDLRGEIASAEEVERFLADPAPDRRGRWSDAFLADRRFAVQLANRWTKLLLVGAGMNSVRMVTYLRPWLEQQFSAGRPLSAIVRQLLTDQCDGAEVDGCGLMLAYFDSIESLTSITARSFLGLQIQCAQCHDHPFDHWKQEDFNRFASFFADTRADFAPLRDREARQAAEERVEQRRADRRAAKHAAAEKGERAAGGEGAMEGMTRMGAMAGAFATFDEADDTAIQCGFIVEDLNPEAVLAKGLRKLEARANAGGKAAKSEPPERRRKRSMKDGGDDAADDPADGDHADDPALAPEDTAGAASRSAMADDGAARVERSDGDAIRELARMLLAASRAGEQAAAKIAREQVVFDRLVAQLAPDARELVEKYKTRREIFSSPGFPDGTRWSPGKGSATKREALADWVVAPGNPWFGPSVANRVVQQLFGKGLIEPVDDLSGSIDRVLPELLDVLGRAFQEHGCDLRFLYSALARTRAYALGAAPTADAYQASVAERWCAAHPARPLTLDQFGRSLLKATDASFGVAVTDEEVMRDEWRVRTLVKSLATLCTAPDGTGIIWWSATIPQALFAMNSELSAVVPADPTVPGYATFADVGRGRVERLAPLWRRYVGREPDAAEVERLFALLTADGDPPTDAELPHAFAALRWALLNSTEFQVNH